MNIFKPFYKETKEYLKNYGDWLKEKRYFLESEITFDSIKDTKTRKWFMLITLYLIDFCDDEDRRFIRLLYFRKNKIAFVSQNFPMCERACQEWREEILKNIIVLAIQERILEIEIKNWRFDKDEVSVGILECTG